MSDKSASGSEYSFKESFYHELTSKFIPTIFDLDNIGGRSDDEIWFNDEVLSFWTIQCHLEKWFPDYPSLEKFAVCEWRTVKDLVVFKVSGRFDPRIDYMMRFPNTTIFNVNDVRNCFRVSINEYDEFDISEVQRFSGTVAEKTEKWLLWNLLKIDHQSQEVF